MNSQTQTQIITIIFVLFFTLTLTPISLVLHILNIQILMCSSSIKSLPSDSTLPCSYNSTMDKSSTLLKKLIRKSASKKLNTVSPVKSTPTESKTMPMPIKLTQAQKEAALPFLTQEPPKPKSTTSKAKVKKKTITPNKC